MLTWQPGVTLEAIEQYAIEQAFQFYRQNKTQTAQSLGIAIRTLDAKLEKYENDRRSNAERLERTRREREAFNERAKGISVTGSSADQGVRVEPTPQPSGEFAMPVQERPQVQEMLQKHTSKSRHSRASEPVSGSDAKARSGVRS